jgi:hypothetical protein
MRFLEHSQQEGSQFVLDGSAGDQAAAALTKGSSDSEENQNGSNSGDKASDDKAIHEEPASFFDELHARIAPSRSLKRRFFHEDTLAWCVTRHACLCAC